MSESECDDKVRLGPEFADALVYTYELHAKQIRKGTETPYLAHLLGVAALVIEAEGDEDQAIAALLHDAAEDQGGEERLAKIERRFGPRVAGIVRECSDTTADDKEEWEGRKARYLERVEKEMTAEALRVSLADKLHNARAIARDHRTHGDEVWTRFSRDKETTGKQYRALAAAYKRGFERVGLTSPHMHDFERAVQDVEAAAGLIVLAA